QSQEISSAVVLLFSLLMLMMLGKGMMFALLDMFKLIHGDLTAFEISPSSVPRYFRWGATFIIKLIGPFAITIIIIGFLSKVSQVGFLFTAKPITPKLKKISPLSGLKRLFSSRGVTELFKGLTKIILIGIISYFTIKSAIPDLLILSDKNVWAVLAEISSLTLKVGFRIIAFILVLAVMDLVFQIWKHKKDLRMSKQEVKDELKQSEGDPLVKSRIRDIQMKMSFNRMIDKLPEADVVITNPTHFAVALKYNSENMSAPVVIAKGKQKLAYKIKSIARELDIPIVEEPFLARELYKAVDIGMEIPYELFQAVAEVLALVYELKNKMKRSRLQI
ncbi:flagellar biosynthesis protein FlhB, partial [bacterium]|nr:flagellar biosynthesis protein FlhB [bacterium]